MKATSVPLHSSRAEHSKEFDEDLNGNCSQSRFQKKEGKTQPLDPAPPLVKEPSCASHERQANSRAEGRKVYSDALIGLQLNYLICQEPAKPS